MGEGFLGIKAARKIGVDPEFQISKKEKYESYFKNISNIFNKYYEMTSDSFFSKYKNILEKTHLDVVFVNGWHGYEQSLRDV